MRGVCEDFLYVDFLYENFVSEFWIQCYVWVFSHDCCYT